MTDEELFAIDTQIPERIWEVTFQAPNGDWIWYRTPMMIFEQACREALIHGENRHNVNGELVKLKLIRIERVPTTVVKPACCTFHTTGGDVNASCGGDINCGIR